MKLSILIASYGEPNQKFVDQCLKSIDNMATDISKVEIELVCVSSGEYKTKYKSDRFPYKVLHSNDRWHYPMACSKAYEMIADDTTHIMLLNDDTIVTKNAVMNLMYIYMQGVDHVILNPMSNCDNNHLYSTMFSWKHGDKVLDLSKQQYKFEDIEPMAKDIMQLDSPFHYPLLIRINYNCFYATIMPRKIWEDVGGIDPEYKTGWDDQDFCIRANKKKYVSSVCANAFIFHFSGTSADKYVTKEERNFNIDRFNKKFDLDQVHEPE